MVISHKSFDHKGGYYHYRIHNLKISKLVNNGLKTYLKNIFHSCPNELFNSGPRSSSLKFKIPVTLKQSQNHEVSELAKHGLELNNDRFLTNHSKVQVFMLENDNKTIAAEIPIWLYKNELQNYTEIFKTAKPLTGHIDILRIEDNKIWIWDYKPNSHSEDFATTQVYFYALMLSKRTNLPLSNFRCGYFDSIYAFTFKPEENILTKSLELTSFI